MRLKSIKLAGFKSFVDPTTVDVRSNLIAVVGPNGSGKSNIIDAVRWVMGESSAKYLRGESMADVIFNGSSGRKPAAHASIELIFDNSEGRLGGQYASYATISLKRAVTRDGQSNYYLNNTRCRRRDIKDIFLGTGLGPRSYAIIMQDTISRLVEAKPEDFRAYIEEVAGIAKYKERRHETELRIKHTRENLDRLTDLRDELETQLRRLDRQAKAAERFKVLKAEERLTKAQLNALQWQEFDQKLQEQQQIILQVETNVEAAVADIRKIDSDFEEKREIQIEMNEAVDAAQATYYSIGAEISKIEQTKQHQQEKLSKIKEDYRKTQESLAQLQQQYEADNKALQAFQVEMQQLQPQLAEAKDQSEVLQEQLHTNEDLLQTWQTQWDQFNDNAQHAKQKVHVEQTKIQHLQQRQQELHQRYDQLQTEHSNIETHDEDDSVVLLQNEAVAAEQQLENIQQQVDDVRIQIQSQREAVQHSQQQLNANRNQLQQARGKYASLEALQQAALNQTENSVLDWLTQHDLNHCKHLAENLEVNSGWEKAVEVVLGNLLEAICVDDIENIYQVIEQLQKGNLGIIAANSNAAMLEPVANSLAKHVKVPPAIHNKLINIIAVENFSEATNILPNLKANQSVITKDGLWLGPGWMKVAHGNDEQQGIIERQKQLVRLQDEISSLEQTILEGEQVYDEQQQQQICFEEKKEELDQLQRQLSSVLSEKQAALKLKTAEIKQQQEKMLSLNQSMNTTKERLTETQEALSLAQENFEEAQILSENDAEQRQVLLTERDAIREQVDQCRQKSREYNDKAHSLALRFESVTAQINSLQSNVERNHSTIETQKAYHQELSAVLENADKPLENLNSELEILLEKRLLAEQELTAARQKLASIDHDLRELTNDRHEAESNAEKLRSQLEQKRMAVENVKVRRSTIEEQLQEMNVILTEIINEMPSDANQNVWQNQLESIQKRIDRLGAINLAAIEEFKEVSERKVYLDAQNEDLEKALRTLEDAIGKIDKETREKFKETYEIVNNHFKQLFPKIFGGGSASLDLTSDDLLETGIVVMARPPGKRNSTIHLLSGGEKALTALALVFSLFQINPAPFCMLDEVDAPLDDANVARFCNLVKEMAKETQFVFISHNKLAIEMADHLVGVTMREPGVSRLVAVDVQEAVQMADA